MIIVLTFVVGISLIRVYGEVEFFFAVLKILLIIFLIILGLVINLGGIPGVDRIGFRYWKHPGPFVEYVGSGSWGKFLGYWAVMTNAVFSFAGVESVAMAAAETRNPRRAIPNACKRVFARVSIFYILAVLIVGMLVSSDDPRLSDESGTAAQSPFVIAASSAGIKAIPSVVNAIVITSAWSSSNQALLAGTRVLYSLALKGQAPKVFLRTTSWGVPYVCVLLQTAFMFLAFMSLSNSALTVFYWFLNLTACGVLISWITILINHQRLILAMKKQGLPLSSLPWHNGWTGELSRFSSAKTFLLTPCSLLDTCCVVLLRRHPLHWRVYSFHPWQLVRELLRSILSVSFPHLSAEPRSYNADFSPQRYSTGHHCLPSLEIHQEDENCLPDGHSPAGGFGGCRPLPGDAGAGSQGLEEGFEYIMGLRRCVIRCPIVCRGLLVPAQ